jgi:hypothetical protein
MDDKNSGFARYAEYGSDRSYRARQLRDVIAKRFAEAAGLQEIALHVDDDERSLRPIEINRAGLGYDDAVGWIRCARHRCILEPKNCGLDEARDMPFAQLRGAVGAPK